MFQGKSPHSKEPTTMLVNSKLQFLTIPPRYAYNYNAHTQKEHLKTHCMWDITCEQTNEENNPKNSV